MQNIFNTIPNIQPYIGQAISLANSRQVSLARRRQLHVPQKPCAIWLPIQIWPSCWHQTVPNKHRHLLHPPTLETLTPEWGESLQANGEIIELQREAIKREMLSSFTWLAPKTTQMSPIFWKRHSQREPLYKATMSIDTSCCLKKKLHDDSEKLASNSKGKKRENKNTCSTPKNLLSF